MGEQLDVLIKVSSLAVHKTLVEPSDTVLAFALLHGIECKPLLDVLIGVWFPSAAGLVTIMKDLTKENYHSLEPCNMPDVSALWNSFARLVHELLLPLARRSVVHCDIRPGWDNTANLMWKNVAEGVQLRLIDYESLCMIETCSKVPKDKRCVHVSYIPQSGEDINIFAFLWWQYLL